MSASPNRGDDWPVERWTRILDRLEFRQPGIGLRFWGPPLWLEVTMSGPDSDQWPASSEQTQQWNWQSSETCTEAERLLRQGADDAVVVMAVGRYTLENLILNAVHEIGEWLRFDGRRLFPAHPPSDTSPLPDDEQGNGSVRLTTMFGAPPGGTPPGAAPAARAQESTVEPRVQHQLERLAERAGPPGRFTYLPGTAVHYHPTGPMLRLHTGSGAATGWRSTWSTATVDALEYDADPKTLIGLVQRDVHGALVDWEAERVCRALYVDRRLPWRLVAPGAPLTLEPAATDGQGEEMVSTTVWYRAPTLS